MPLQRALHFTVIAIVRSEKIRAYKEKNDICFLEMIVDLSRKFRARTDSAIMPEFNDSLTLKDRQLAL